MPATSDRGGRIVRRLHHLHDHVRIELRRRGRQVAHHLRQAIGRHHRDDAGQVAEGGEDGGGLRGDHRRAVERALRRGDGGGEIADVDGRWRRSRAAAPARARRTPPSGRRRSTATIERQRSSRLAGSATSPSSRASSFRVVDLLDRDRASRLRRPDRAPARRVCGVPPDRARSTRSRTRGVVLPARRR